MYSVIKSNVVYPTIKMCYSEDEELISTFHIKSGTDIHICAKDTVNVIKKDKAEFFIVYMDNEVIGYFGKSVVKLGSEGLINYLCSFFIRPKFRNVHHRTIFWQSVNNEFNNNIFCTAIYNKNIRASRFLKKFTNMVYPGIIDNEKIEIFYFNV